MELWQHGVALFGGVILAAFHIDFQEAVEKDFSGLEAEHLASLVGSDLDAGVQDLGVFHLRGDGPFPDQLIELLFLG